MAASASEPLSAGREPAPAFDAEQEIRFALVMYGGVSLAIYIYGIA